MTRNMTETGPARWRHLTGGVALSLVSAVSFSAVPAFKAQPGKLSEVVRSEGAAKGAAKINVIVRFRQAPGARERSLVGAFGGRVRRQFRSSSRWMAVEVPGRAVMDLANNKDVEFVAIDAPMYSAMDVARQAADEPLPSVPESSFKGAGVTIAMLDSGVAPHPGIQTLAVAVDTVGNDPPVVSESGVDPNGHGTHVAGILVGNGSHSFEGRLRGLAPEARLVSVRVLDDLGRGQTSDVLAGLQWVVDHKDEFGIRVLNLSIGHPVYEPAAQDPLVQGVEAAWDAGIVVVCSAGNGGASGHGTISSPCNSRKVITVGALNAWHTPDPVDDTVTSYSSRGPTRGDLVAKPDLIAPGNRIVSARSPGSHLDVAFPERRVAGDPNQPEELDYFELSGTSMAAPIVSGTAALMLEQDPALNPASVKARLMLSTRKAFVADPFTTGAGALDILAALRTGGTVTAALSPLVLADSEQGEMTIENTAVLWSDASFPLTLLWSEAVLWPDGTEPEDPLFRSNGVLWPPTNTPYPLLWPDHSLDAVLWPDTALWAEAVLWPDNAPPEIVTESEAAVVDDP